MSATRHHRQHGSIFAGRIMVIVGCLLVLVANGLVFRDAAKVPPRLPLLELLTVISLIWMFAGAWGICTRRGWMRYLVLTILYIGSLGFFLTGVITSTTGDGPMVGRLTPIFIATGVYLYVSLVFTHSKHIRRLTSRAYE